MYPRVITFFLLAFLFIQGRAQDFEVSPVVVQFETNSGESETRKLTVKNYYAVKQKFTLKLVDYTLDEKGLKQPAALGSTDRSLSNNLVVNPSYLELNPGESGEVELNMTIPKTDASTRWGMIQVQVSREKSSADADKNLATGVIVIPRIVVIVTQSPGNNANYQAKIEQFVEIDPNEKGYRTFEVTLRNSGSNIISGQLYLALANMATAEEKKYDSQEVTIYPDATKKVEISLPETIEPGKYALAALFDYGHQMPIEGLQIMISQP
jgi:hypothetical protein